MMLVAMNRLGDGLGRHTRAPTPNFGLIGVWVNECFSRGTIRLASADPLAQPIVEENMLDDPSDVLRMRDGIKRLIDLARRPGFADIAEFIGTGASTAGIDTLDSDAAIDTWAHAECRRRTTRHEQLPDGFSGRSAQRRRSRAAGYSACAACA